MDFTDIMDLDSESTPPTEAHELIWALLDEQISEPDFQRLEAMLRDDEEVRRLYVQCVQIHVDLQQWFGGKEEAGFPRAGGAPLDLRWSGDSPLTDAAF